MRSRIRPPRKALGLVEVRLGSGHGAPGQIAAIGVRAVEGKEVQSVDGVRNQARGHHGVARPTSAMDLRAVLEAVVAGQDVARSVQQESQVMAMGSELELEILIVGTDKKDLAYLVVP